MAFEASAVFLAETDPAPTVKAPQALASGLP